MQVTPKPAQIASWGHLTGYLLITAGITAWGFHIQKAGLGNAPAGRARRPQPGDEGRPACHSGGPGSCCITAGRGPPRGGTLDRFPAVSGIHGGCWPKTLRLQSRSGCWWEATAYGVHWLLGPGDSARSVTALLPQSLSEVLVWVQGSITAGFCEKLQTRGYVQRQFHALTGNIVAAVLGQGYCSASCIAIRVGNRSW